MHTLLDIGTSLPPGDELFDLPPEGFVAARDSLVRRLRADGSKDEARSVAGLRRPSVAAWALNQVARANRDDVDALLDAGETLQKGGGDFRAAMDRYRELARTVTAAAADALRASGREPDTLTAEIRGTLDAAVGDPDLAEALRAGRLQRTADPASVGFTHAGVPAPSSQATAAAGKKEQARRERREQAEAEAEARQRRHALDEANDAVRRAEQAVRAAERDLRSAERDRDRAQKAFDRAQQQLNSTQ